MNNAPCVFTKRGIVVLCYADDLVQFTEQDVTINKIKEELRRRFLIKNLGKPKRILGLDVTWHSDGFLSMQRAPLIKKLLNKTGMENSEPIGNPINPLSFVNDSERTTLN